MDGLLGRTVVGRDAELALLGRAVRAARGGSGAAVALVGDGGAGKSRLRAETERAAADQGVVVLSGRAVQGAGARPFRALAEAVAAGLRDPAVRASGTVGLLRPTLALLDDAASRPRDSAMPVGLVGVAEAVLDLLAVAGAGRGALLSIDDVHWSDPDELAVLEYLVDATTAHRAAILLTSRPHGDAAGLVDQLHRRRSLTVVELAPLAPSDVDQLVLSCLQQDACPAELSAFVRDRADGNPFHVEELLAGLRRSGALLHGPDGWYVVGHRLRTTAPTTWTRSLQARLRELSPGTRRLLGGLAVLGHQAEWSLLERVLDESRDHVQAAVREAGFAQLTVVAGTSVRFRHALVRDEVVAALLPPEREQLARAALAAVREEHPGLPGRWCDVAAGLAELAGESGAAADLLERAAENARTRGALASAEGMLRRAMDLDPASAPRVEIGLARVYALAGDVDRALATGTQALGRRRSTGGSSRAPTAEDAGLELTLARALAAGGRGRDALIHVAAARRGAVGEGRAELADRVDVTTAVVLLAAGDAPAAEELAAAVAARTQAAPDVRCEALEVQGRCVRLRDVSAAESCFSAALDVAVRHDLPGWRARALHELGTVDLLDTMRLDRLQEARGAAVAAGSPATVVAVDFHLGEALVARGETAAARETSLRAAELARRLGSGILPYALVTAARSYAHERRGEEMEALLDQAVGHAPGDVEVEASTWDRARAMLALHQAEPEEALAALDRAAALLADRPAHHTPHRGLWALLSTLHGPDGGLAAREATREGPGAGTRFNRGLLAAADAVVSGREGNPSEADTGFRAALDDVACYERGDWIPHLVGWLVAPAAHSADWGEPVTWLQQAVRWFADHDQPALATSARVRLRQLGAPVPRQGRGESRVPPTLGELGVTSREVDVLSLLPERLTNREVADRLVLSPRTVEKHVAALLAKTGRTDRRSLAALAEELGLTG
ncbi:MAG TPA: AAA family ATPase [Jiangellales bacterium]|nr:AAA family ATPase [Jiangellales bacterium]